MNIFFLNIENKKKNLKLILKEQKFQNIEKLKKNYKQSETSEIKKSAYIFSFKIQRNIEKNFKTSQKFLNSEIF